MAKLVEILARELKEWPGEWRFIVQEGDCELYAGNDKLRFGGRIPLHGAGSYFYPSVHLYCLAEDWETAKVTRYQWKAERARQLAESSKFTEVDKAHIQELTDLACGKRSKEDQALWDKVAVAALQSLTPILWELSGQYDSGKQLVKCQVESAFDYADAFMTERAKRMKGGE